MILAKKKEFKKRHSLQSIFFYSFLGIIILIIIAFLVISNLRINRRKNEFLTQINYLKKEIQLLEEKKAQYEAGIFQAETEAFREKRIREEGYRKPGEEVVVVLPQEEIIKEENKEDKGFWQKIWDIFYSIGN